MSLRIELPAYTARTQLLGTGRWAEAGMTRDPFEMEMNAECGYSEVAACFDTPALEEDIHSLDIYLRSTVFTFTMFPS